jgi:hypothetical protein
MKITPALFATLLISTLTAQEPAPAPPAAPEPAKPQLRTTPPSPVAPPPGLTTQGESLPLIPETPENTQKAKGEAVAPQKSDKTTAAETELAAHLRLRELRSQALKDPKIQAEWARAHATKTDAERRVLLTSFYNMLYGKMAKLDSSMEKRITALQTVAVRRLAQHNMEASVSIEKPGEPIDNDYDDRNR